MKLKNLCGKFCKATVIISMILLVLVFLGVIQEPVIVGFIGGTCFASCSASFLLTIDQLKIDFGKD